MAFIVHERFFKDPDDLYQAAKQALEELKFTFLIDDPSAKYLHAHGDWRGGFAHVEVRVDGGRGRGIYISVVPGDEGKYLDLARVLLEKIRKKLAG